MGPRSRHQASPSSNLAFLWLVFWPLACREPQPFRVAAEQPGSAQNTGGTAFFGGGGRTAGESTEGGRDDGNGASATGTGGEAPRATGGAGAATGGRSGGGMAASAASEGGEGGESNGGVPLS